MSRDLFWTSAALLARTVGQMLLTLAVVTRLSPALGGLWFNFVSLGNMVQFLDLGMSATVLRSASHLHSGVKELKARGLHAGERLKEPNLPELKALMATTRLIYGLLGFAVLGLAVIMAFTALKPMTNDTTRLAWMLFAAGMTFQHMISQRYNFLQGVGRLIQAQQIQVLGLLLAYGGAAAALFATGSLLWTCGTFAFGSLLQLLAYQASITAYSGGKASPAQWKAAWPNTWRSGLSRLSQAALYQLPTIVISSMLGVVIGGRYGFTVQICMFLCAVAQLPVVAMFPRINALAAKGALPELKRLFFDKNRQMFALYFIFGALVALAGPWLLAQIHAKTSLLPLPYLAAILGFFFFENHRNNYVFLVGAFNFFPFWKYDLLSALAATAGGVWAVQAAGLAGLITWLWIVQLCWNFWWPVKVGLKHLKTPWAEYLGIAGLNDRP